jgi:hypothetical protein
MIAVVKCGRIEGLTADNTMPSFVVDNCCLARTVSKELWCIDGL